MKLLMITAILLLTGTSNYVTDQERFRRDYKQLILTVSNNPEKSGEYNGHNIFIFNFNEKGYVMHITENRKKIMYIRTSPIGKDQHETGEKYSFFKALDKIETLF